MIDREDMLALTRRMTVKRTSMTRIAGGYMDSDGCIDGTFNIAFLKLSPADREKNLQIAKKVPFAETNQNLQEYKFLQENMHTIIGLLKRDCGISFMYKIAVADELESGVLKEIKLSDFKMQHDFDFIWEKDSIYTDKYIKICKELSISK